jgi:hypothetical protein
MKFKALHQACLDVDHTFRKSIPLEDRKKGCLGGVTLDDVVVLELNSRKTIHAHEIATGPVPPILVQSIAADPELSAILCESLDTIIQSEIPVDCHENIILRHLPPTDPNFKEGPLRSSLCPIENPSQSGDQGDTSLTCCHQFQKVVNDIVSVVNVHGYGHTDTCHKYDRNQCRMAYEQMPHNDKTCIYEIEMVEEPTYNSKGEIKLEKKVAVKEYGPGEAMQHFQAMDWTEIMSSKDNPFPSMDPRCLVLAFQRRGYTYVDPADPTAQPDLLPDGTVRILADGTQQYSGNVLRIPERANSMVVQYIDIYTNLAQCNTSQQVYVNVAEAKNAMYYCVKVCKH